MNLRSGKVVRAGKVVRPPARRGNLIGSWHGDLAIARRESKEMIAESVMKKWMTWAEIALSSYNAKEGANFKPLWIRGLGMSIDMPTICVHICFKGSNTAGVKKLFFAEMLVPLPAYKELEIEVRGCCALKKVKSEISNGGVCVMCCVSRVLHPIPSDGYCRESGDMNFPIRGLHASSYLK